MRGFILNFWRYNRKLAENKMKRYGVDSVHSWMIAALIFFIQAAILGIGRLVSFLFVASMDRYGIGRKEASLPFTLAACVTCMSGPLAGVIATKIGKRFSSCLGCIFAAIGVGGCFLAETITLITFLWGILFAVGQMLCVCMLSVYIIQYFDKQRGTAAALSGLGMSFGGFVFPIIYYAFLDKYGLSGTFLLLSGFLLNCIPATLLLKPPDFIRSTTKTEQIKQTANDNIYEDEEVYNAVNIQNNPKCVSVDETKAGLLIDGSAKAHQPIPKTENWNRISTYDDSEQSATLLSPDVTKAKIELLQCSSPKDGCADRAMENNISGVNCNSEQLNKKKRLFKTLKIFCDPVFHVLIFSKSIHVFLISAFLTIIIDFAKDIEIEESDLKYIPTSTAVGEVVGRLLLGWVADKKYVTSTTLQAISYIGLGVIRFGIAWSTGIYTLSSWLFFNGFFTSMSYFVYSLVVGDLFSAENRIMALASSTFFAGPLILSIPALIGFFRVKVGSYKYMFVFISAANVLGGIVWLMTPCIAKLRKYGSRKSENSEMPKCKQNEGN